MTRDLLIRRREVIKADLLLKFEVGDWHGVQDCASDIREIEAMLPLIPESILLNPLSQNNGTGVYSLAKPA